MTSHKLVTYDALRSQKTVGGQIVPTQKYSREQTIKKLAKSLSQKEILEKRKILEAKQRARILENSKDSVDRMINQKLNLSTAQKMTLEDLENIKKAIKAANKILPSQVKKKEGKNENQQS